MNPNYHALRFAHFRITLKTWFRGLDQALIAIVAVLQFILTAVVAMLVVGLAQALGLLADPAAPPGWRLAVVSGWLAVSFILLRAMREAAFMPRARAFFDTLPVAPAQKLRADLLLASICYSFLWLPVGWVLFDPLGMNPGTTAAPVLELVLMSLCANLAILRGARLPALVALAALMAFAGMAGRGIVAEFARLACAALAGLALWYSYLPARSTPPGRARRHARLERLALGSGLVTALLANGLRVNLLIRVSVIGATLATCLVVMRLRTNDASSASVVVFVTAVAAVALYSLPALCRNTLLTRLDFLAGQPAFARRMRLAAYGIPVALFALATACACAWPFDRSGRAVLDAGVFSVLFLLGVAGARLRWRPVSWLMPFATLISLIVLAAMT